LHKKLQIQLPYDPDHVCGAEENYNAVREEVLYQKTCEMSKNPTKSNESSTDPSDMDSSTENLSGTNFKKNHFIGGGNRSIRRKPQTCRRSLTKCYHIMLYPVHLARNRV
jgi:hypothetical protein